MTIAATTCARCARVMDEGKCPVCDATLTVTASELDEMRERAQDIYDWDPHSGVCLIIEILDRIKAGGTNGKS